MGHRIQSYTLAELKRISVPGVVAPCLFWALPIGSWSPEELDEMWRYFTEGENEAREYGLLIVRDTDGFDGGQQLDLQSLGAKLEEVVPRGLKGHVRASAFDVGVRRMLVLSGGYPQPGWGVLVECSGGAESFGSLIRRSLASLDPGGASQARLKPFTDAREYLRKFRKLESMVEPIGDLGLRQSQQVYQRWIAQLEQAKSMLLTGQHRKSVKKLNAALATWNKGNMSVLFPELRPPLERCAVLLQGALIIREVPPETLATEVEPLLEEMVANASGIQSAQKRLIGKAKYALTECLELRRLGFLAEGAGIATWAERMLAEVPAQCAGALDALGAAIKQRLLESLGKMLERGEEEEEEANSVAVVTSPTAVLHMRTQFHKAMGEAVELQCELGAQFLVSFEEISHKDGLWKRSIPWDPARMVGWKIFCAGEPVAVYDLEYETKYQRHDLHSGASTESGNQLADGGHFTDYVHHSASSGSVTEPRRVTSELLPKLLRPSQQKGLITKYGGTAEVGLGAKPLVEQLLETFGWYSMGEGETPLAACIEKGIGELWILKRDMTPNSVRIVLESFCKDVLDVVVSKLGYNHQEIWAAVQERCPKYKLRHGKKNWIEELRYLSSGSAIFLIRALAPLVFPKEEVSEMVKILNKLVDIGNEAAHHVAPEQIVQKVNELPTLIRKLLDNTAELLGELPWHLAVDNVFGSLPKVLSGEAWSHGSSMPRRLKVIMWEGETDELRVTIWNRSRRNPVVTDPVFISRPGPE